jgi:hypothetical protein
MASCNSFSFFEKFFLFYISLYLWRYSNESYLLTKYIFSNIRLVIMMGSKSCNDPTFHSKENTLYAI